MALPLIGITTYRTHNRSNYAQICINEAYIASLVEAGAAPVLIPLGLETEILEFLLARLDGVLFSGGGDIEPARYGSQTHFKVSNVDSDRDQVEICLFHLAVKRQIPFLGICRGLQLINVALGGGLYEDILDQRPGSLLHQSPENLPRDHLSHSVQIEPASKLAQIFGMSLTRVNSQHHQAVKELAPNLISTAVAPDGILEAFELADYPYGLAVQWHPEWLRANPAMRALFRSFVQAAERLQQK